MSTIYYYRVYCTTDAQNEYIWAEDQPVTCPINSAHSIDITKTSIIDKRDPNVTQIQEETVPTGGHFQSTVKQMDIAANETKIFDYTWPHPISVLSIHMVTESSNKGDTVDLLVSPDTLIGSIITDVAKNDTIINVSSSVIENVKVGFYLTLTDGTITSDLGRVLSIDSANNTVTVETGSSNAFLSTTPTYIRQNIYMLKNWIIGPAWNYTIGESKIGGSYVPANTTIRVIYTNNSNSAAKTLYPEIEYLY
jgi:hypothetical protein